MHVYLHFPSMDELSKDARLLLLLVLLSRLLCQVALLIRFLLPFAKSVDRSYIHSPACNRASTPRLCYLSSYLAAVRFTRRRRQQQQQQQRQYEIDRLGRAVHPLHSGCNCSQWSLLRFSQIFLGRKQAHEPGSRLSKRGGLRQLDCIGSRRGKG